MTFEIVFSVFCSVGVVLSRGHGKYFFKGNVSLEAGEDLIYLQYFVFMVKILEYIFLS